MKRFKPHVPPFQIDAIFWKISVKQFYFVNPLLVSSIFSRYLAIFILYKSDLLTGLVVFRKASQPLLGYRIPRFVKHYYYTTSEFFTAAFADDLCQESAWQHISLCFLDASQ